MSLPPILSTRFLNRMDLSDTYRQMIAQEVNCTPNQRVLSAWGASDDYRLEWYGEEASYVAEIAGDPENKYYICMENDCIELCMTNLELLDGLKLYHLKLVDTH